MERNEKGRNKIREGRHYRKHDLHELIRTECRRFLSMLYSNQMTKDTMEQV